MSAEPITAKAASRAAAELKKAISQAKQAYEFVPNTYTFSCLNACLAAEQALDVLRAALESDVGDGGASP